MQARYELKERGLGERIALFCIYHMYVYSIVSIRPKGVEEDVCCQENEMKYAFH